MANHDASHTLASGASHQPSTSSPPAIPRASSAARISCAGSGPRTRNSWNHGPRSGTSNPGIAAIRAAAEAAGLTYVAIPVTHAGFSHPQIDAMTQALVGADGPVLAYCRSGTRSCNLWALAAAKAGRNPELLVAQARVAGYDLSGMRPTLDALAGGQ